MANALSSYRILHYIRDCLRRRGRTREDAEDLVQEAFVRLELYCREGNEVKEPEAFLMRTAMNLSVDYHRHVARSPFSRKPLEKVMEFDLSSAPDEVFAADERLEAVKRTLDAVSRKTRDIFFMQRLGGFSYAEIADKYGVSVSAIEKHIASAAAALAQERQRHGQ